ncbi:MAG: hypothetical protein AB7E37_04200 [Candidatus Altimarinota bacterium]
MVTTNEYKNDSKVYKSMNLSIILFVFVLFITIGLYFYNMTIVSKINSTQTQVANLEESIKKVNEDEKVKLFTLIQSNRSYLEKYKALSNIPLFINTVKELGRTNRVIFEGFSYSDGEIISQVTAQNDAVSLASVKTAKFLEYFRKKDDHIFSLGFVNSFQGQDSLSFPVKFKVK